MIPAGFGVPIRLPKFQGPGRRGGGERRGHRSAAGDAEGRERGEVSEKREEMGWIEARIISILAPGWAWKG